MTVEKHDVVDAIGTKRTTGDVILTICDHLDWNDEHSHLLTLQEKLNCYLRFIESGQIFEDYPNASGRKLVIDVVALFDIPAIGFRFLADARKPIESAGIALRWRHQPSDDL